MSRTKRLALRRLEDALGEYRELARMPDMPTRPPGVQSMPPKDLFRLAAHVESFNRELRSRRTPRGLVHLERPADGRSVRLGELPT